MCITLIDLSNKRTVLKDALPGEIIEKVKYQVNRDTPEDKLQNFMDWMILVRKEVLYLVTQ